MIFMGDSSIYHIWEAADYYHHSSVQYDAAMQLLKVVHFNGHENILDIGCGDGKITAVISNKVLKGSTLGIDLSKEMIEFAQKLHPKETYPNLNFAVRDAQHLCFDEMFDIAFSSFAIQWFCKIDAFFKGLYDSLRSNGYLVATIPLGISFELEESIEKTISLPKWSCFFKTMHRWNFKKEVEYLQLLTLHHFAPTLFVTVMQEVIFPSRNDFEKYVIQWFSYLNYVPVELKEIFFKKIIDEYLKLIPSDNKEEIRFAFPRLDIIASKASL